MLSSSVEVPSPGGMSGLSGLSAAARNVVRSSSISGAMYSLEKSPSSGGPDSTSLTGNKKRRSSLGAKMVAIVGLSQWSKSTQQLNQQGQSDVGFQFVKSKLNVKFNLFTQTSVFTSHKFHTGSTLIKVKAQVIVFAICPYIYNMFSLLVQTRIPRTFFL